MIYSAYAEDFFGHSSTAAAYRPQGDAFALELRQIVKRLCGSVK